LHALADHCCYFTHQCWYFVDFPAINGNSLMTVVCLLFTGIVFLFALSGHHPVLIMALLELLVLLGHLHLSSVIMITHVAHG